MRVMVIISQNLAKINRFIFKYSRRYALNFILLGFSGLSAGHAFGALCLEIF